MTIAGLFPDGPDADSFTEKTFKGPLHIMLQDALSHIHSMVIEEKVIKYPDRPEADRFFNYPFPAVEEALCNAVYHRSYEIREPVEVRVLPDSITIGSFPGPDRSIRDQDMREFRFLSRRYRNRRVGELLKELEMTEGRGTGIPKMLREIKKNGSSEPIFHTDNDRTFFLVEFPVHPVFAEALEKKDVREVTTEVKRLLNVMTGDHSRKELQEMLRLKNAEHFHKAYLLPAIDAGLVEMTLPEEVIEAYHQGRLQALEALEKIKDISTKVITHTDDEVPYELVGNDMARRYYGCVRYPMAEYVLKDDKPGTEIALRIVERIAKHKIRDWRTNEDAINKMRGEIDDILFEVAAEHRLELSLDDHDAVIDRCIEVAIANED